VKPASVLLMIKLVHTVVWAFFVSCILAIPLAAATGRFPLAAMLIGLVLIEVVILAVNRGSCPLTNIAERYTSDRKANFDIFLPLWVAKNNKVIFGALFIAGAIYAAYTWWLGNAT